MKARLLVSAVGVPFLLVVLIVLPDWATMLLTAALAAIAAHEMLHATGAAANFRLTAYSVVFAAAVPFWCYFGMNLTIAAAAVFALMLLSFVEMIFTHGREKAVKLIHILTVLFSAVVIPLMLSCLLLLRMHAEYGKAFVLAPLVAAFLSDTMAFFMGLAFGKHKLAPRVSPKKTVEGSIGGLLGGVLGMLVYGAVLKFALSYDVSLPLMAIYGFVGSILGQIGDLSFSVIKREYDIKDYGKLLPGHGGVLDRFDSVIFVAPVFWLLLCAI